MKCCHKYINHGKWEPIRSIRETEPLNCSRFFCKLPYWRFNKILIQFTKELFMSETLMSEMLSWEKQTPNQPHTAAHTNLGWQLGHHREFCLHTLPKPPTPVSSLLRSLFKSHLHKAFSDHPIKNKQALPLLPILIYCFPRHLSPSNKTLHILMTVNCLWHLRHRRHVEGGGVCFAQMH